MVFQSATNAKKSTWLVMLSMAVLVIMSVISEFRQASDNPLDGIDLFQNPISFQTLDGLQSFTLKNRLGEFSIEKRSQGNKEGWRLTQPRSLPAKAENVQRIISSLRNIKVRKVYRNDIVNRNNYRMDNPLYQVNLQGLTKADNVELKVGFINSLDKSAYLATKKSKFIYQVDLLQFPLEKLDLSSFIDSRVLPVQQNEIKELNIFLGKANGQSPVFGIKNREKEWFSHRGRPFDEEKLVKFLKDLIQFPTNTILDKRTKKMEETINRYLKRPAYEVQIKTKKGDSFLWSFSHTFSTIPDLNIEKRKFIVVRSPLGDHPMIVSRELLKFFQKREGSFKKLNVKKLFY